MNIVPAPKTDPIQVDFVTSAESLIKKAVKEGDFDSGFSVINILYEQAETVTQVIGTGFDMLEKAWDKFDHEEGDSFFNAAVRNTKLNPVTIRNRINVSELLRSGRIPKIHKEQIRGLGQKSLIRIANTAKSKYAISKDDWERLAETTSEQEVDLIAREIENKKPRSNFVGLYYDDRFMTAYINGRMVGLYEKINPTDPDAVKGREVAHARAKMINKVEY